MGYYFYVTNDAEFFIRGDGLAALVCLAEFTQVRILGVLVGKLHDRQAVGAHFELFLVEVLCDLLLVILLLVRVLCILVVLDV